MDALPAPAKDTVMALQQTMQEKYDHIAAEHQLGNIDGTTFKTSHEDRRRGVKE